MRERYVAAIDQGTASSRCLVFDRSGRIVSVAQKEHRHIYPRPGWVEHDPEEIWRNVEHVVATCAGRGAAASRRTWSRWGSPTSARRRIVWDRQTGAAGPQRDQLAGHAHRPHRARAWRREFGQEHFRERSGLPLATYFSGPKLRWLLDNVPGLAQRAEAGEVLFGTMDSWLIWRLTGRHLTDVTNASRTLLMNLHTLDWDEELLEALGVPRAMLPEIRPSAEVYGEAGGLLAGVPVAAALGDQQAALFGQTCFAAGEAKCTYGTGSFLLLNTGDRAGAVGQRPADDALLPGRRRAADLRAGGLDRGHRRARAVVPRQPGADRLGAGDRDPGADRRGQRRLLLRARVLRAVRAALAQRRARRDRRSDRLHHQGAPGPGRAGGDRLADARGRGGDDLRRRHVAEHPARRRRHDRQQPADAVPRRCARRAGGAARTWPRPSRWARPTPPGWRSASGRTPTRCGPTGTWRPNGCPTWSPTRRERGYRKWRKAVARAIDWLDEDDD